MINATIEQCMNRDFAKITPDMPVVEATRLLIQKEVLGGPVIDKDGMLLGWISEQECLQVCIQVLYHNERVSTVEKIMRKDVLSVTLQDDFLNLASQMLSNKPKSYPVLDAKGKVLGVVSRRRILKMMDQQIGNLGASA
ncbi:MAG: CBS domain-containing protein [Pseudomonadales bacterium]|nr:CBS domain-containing protein [Pseudomonadales bacterium]